VSGWDLAARGGRGAPRPTRRLVPAGSVYFFERVDGQPFTRDDALRLWFSAWGRGQTEGFGRLVPGWWSVEGGNP
jgi:CRISPR-associated protein Cmr3